MAADHPNIRSQETVDSALTHSDAGLLDRDNAAFHGVTFARQNEIVSAHPGLLLRGLFHSDGCRVTNWTARQLTAGPKRYEYPRYLFSNESRDIIGVCTGALDLIGVHWTMPRANMVSVARGDDGRRLDELIGPKA